jgi:hypothetical protein
VERNSEAPRADWAMIVSASNRIVVDGLGFGQEAQRGGMSERDVFGKVTVDVAKLKLKPERGSSGDRIAVAHNGVPPRIPGIGSPKPSTIAGASRLGP